MTKPARIVHVMGWRSQQYGSFERFVVALCRRCREAGMESHLVFQAPPASERFVADAGAAIHVLPPARQAGDPVQLARTVRLLRRIGPTHVHAHFGYDSYNALAAARLLGVERRFTTKHIVPSSNWWELPGPRHRWLARQVEVFWAVSHWVAEQLLTLGVPEAKIEVCHLGADPQAYRPDPDLRERTRASLGIDDGTRMLLSTSHLRPGKGTELLPRLAAELAADPGDVTLLAAGGGPLESTLREEARTRGLDEARFRLLGVREDVPALLAAADGFVFTTQANEGMGLGVLEAMAAGAPVVASAVSDIARLPGDVVRLVPQGDADALVRACRELLTESPDAAAARSHRGRELVGERFSVRAAVDAHVRRYRG